MKRAGDRVIAAVPAQPSGYRPEMPTLSYDNNMKGWGPELCARRPDITMVDTFLTNMYRARADFVYTVPRDFVRGYMLQFNRGTGPVNEAITSMIAGRLPWGRDHHRRYRELVKWLVEQAVND